MNYLKYLKENVEIIVFFILVIVLAILILRRSWEGFYNEQHGINRLDAIIYINLENRADRKELLMKELEKLNTNMCKVHKVSGVYMPKNGHKGCIQSHILALNMIKLNKWNRVLILEDDAELDINPDTFNGVINKSLEELDVKHPEWDVIMLGTANKVLDDTKTDADIPLNIEYRSNSNRKSKSNNNNKNNNSDTKTIKLQKLKTATTSSAYIVKDTYVDNILNLFNTCNKNMEPHKLTDNGFEIWALDQKWAEIQSKDNWFCYNKDPIKQRDIWSTILSESHYKNE